MWLVALPTSRPSRAIATTTSLDTVPARRVAWVSSSRSSWAFTYVIYLVRLIVPSPSSVFIRRLLSLVWRLTTQALIAQAIRAYCYKNYCKNHNENTHYCFIVYWFWLELDTRANVYRFKYLVLNSSIFGKNTHWVRLMLLTTTDQVRFIFMRWIIGTNHALTFTIFLAHITYSFSPMAHILRAAISKRAADIRTISICLASLSTCPKRATYLFFWWAAAA